MQGVGGRMRMLPEAVAERTDEKVEGLISLGIAPLFVVKWPLIALTTTLRLISAGLRISHCFCCRWRLIWVRPHPIIPPCSEYVNVRLLLQFFVFFTLKSAVIDLCCSAIAVCLAVHMVKQIRDQNVKSVWRADVMMQLFAEVILLLMVLLHKNN